MKNQWKVFKKAILEGRVLSLPSLGVQDDLNREVWNDKDELKPDIRSKLLEIAKDFWENQDLRQVKIKDIIFTGSLANYNWSKFSDIDLHIVIDYTDVNKDAELVRKYFNSVKAAWNRNHDIRIKDYEVEIYVQDYLEPHIATGIYSVQNDEWIKKPSKFQPEIDYKCVTVKANCLMDEVDELQDEFDDENYQQVHKNTISLKEKIRNMRQSGLEDGGAFSVENLAFKVLRRNGYLKTLNDLKLMSYDKMQSIEEEA
jgi:predicted nucleotidyltransferase